MQRSVCKSQWSGPLEEEKDLMHLINPLSHGTEWLLPSRALEYVGPMVFSRPSELRTGWCVRHGIDDRSGTASSKGAGIGEEHSPKTLVSRN